MYLNLFIASDTYAMRAVQKVPKVYNKRSR